MSRSAEEFLQLSATAKISLHVRNGQFDNGSDDDLKGWRVCPELPLPEELMAAEPSPLLVNRIDTPPKSKREYLETHHRLYRCEGIEPLRQAISEFRKTPGMQEGEKASIYTQVHIQGYLLSKLGPLCRIAFSTERSPTKVIWRQSDRLTPGGLVALSNDSFRTHCLVATIASRPLVGGLEPDVGEDKNTPPRVDISWADSSAALIDPTAEMVMLEAKSGYFENVRYPMLGLQHAAMYESPLDRYIIDVPSEIQPVKYLQELADQTAVMPESAKQFDPSQLEAFRAMSSRELSIVQGPPGTGKTFTSIVAIESYVKTLRQCENPPAPIVIAAQTNHALDQLLQHCLHRGVGKIARLGGQSRSPAVEEYSMFNLRHSSKAKQTDSRSESTRKILCRRLRETFHLCFQDGLINAEDIYNRGLITRDQYESLTENEWESIDQQESGDDTSDGAIAAWLDDFVQEEPVHVYQPPQGQDDAAGEDEVAEEPKDDQAQQDRDDEDKYRLQGEFIPIKPSRTGCIPQALVQNGGWWHRAEWYLANYSDLYEIKPMDRGIVYRYLRSKIMEQAAKEIRGLLAEYKEVCDTIRVSRWVNYLRVVQHEGIEIVGCTTTGLTKHRGLLAAMMPRIMLIEEAAETREANITSAIFPSLEQLVLVGDHQQLTPHVDIRHLGMAPYNLNVSLFERLVELKMPYNTLKVQRRMIPAIREVVQTFYPELTDHPTVKEQRHRPPVPGMGGVNLWWFQHQWPEGRNDSLSWLNFNEAEMIVGFVKYLVQNGIHPNQITILTYYNAQLELIQRLLRGNAFLGRFGEEWSVRTVDGFQGEENDVILLSLVRSPTQSFGQAKAGFVEDENRAVVATSRARRGLYIFGNARNLLDSSNTSRKTWQKVYSAFKDQTGHSLPVTCKCHGNTTEVRNHEGWQKVSAGGCNQPCGKKCPNGHACSATCHAADQEHSNTCKETCPKVLKCGHPCIALCKDECRCADRCALLVAKPAVKKPATIKSAATKFDVKMTAPMTNAAQRAERQAVQGRRRCSPTAPASGVSSQSTTPATQTPSSSGDYITSDYLIEIGFHNCINSGTGGAPEAREATGINARALELALRQRRTPSPQTLSEKWSDETVKRKEAQLREDLRREQQQSQSSSPTKSSIIDTHIPTRIDASGRRVVGLPVRIGTLIDVSEDVGEEDKKEEQEEAKPEEETVEDLIQFD